MSRAVVEIQKGNFDFAFGLVEQFINVCPDEIWTKKFGGWPIWQQVYHALDAISFFVAAADATPAPGPAPERVGALMAQGETPLSKDAVRDFAGKAKKLADAYISELTDASLPALSEGATARMGRDTPHAAIMALLSGHLLYHLGSCDAALRENGLKGVF